MSLPMLGVMDLAPVGAKIDDIIRLTGVVIEITIDEKNQRDFRSGLAKMADGIDNLRRLPGTAYAVEALSRELEKARRIQDPAEGVREVSKLLQKLKEAHKLADEARKEEQRLAKERAKARRKAMVDEIAYQSTREEVQNLLASLDDRSLVHTVKDISDRVIKARQDREAADELLAKGSTKEALQAIRVVLKDCQKILKDWQKRGGKANDRYPKLLKKATGYYNELSAVTILSPSESASLVNGLRLLISPLLDPEKVTKEQATLIEQDIEQLYQEGKALVVQRQKDQAETKLIVAPIVKKIQDLLVIALGRELAEELLAAREAEKLLEQREYAKARERAQGLISGYGALETRLTTAYGDWTRAKKNTLPTLTQTISEQEEAQKQGLAFRHAPEGLMAARLQLEDGLMATRTYTEANAALGVLQRQVEENAAQLRGWKGIAEHRAQVQEEVRQQLVVTQKALTDLSVKMVEAMKGREGAPQDWAPHDIGGLSARLKTCTAGWEALCKTATTVEELAVAPTLTELRAIATAAGDIAQNVGSIDKLVDADLRNAMLARFETARAKLVTAIPQWAIFPIPHIDQIRQALETGQQAITESSDASAAQLTPIVEAVEQAYSKGAGEAALVGGLLDSARQGLARRVVEARAAVGKVKEAAEQRSLLSSSEVRKVRERCLLESQRLSEQVETIAGRHASDVLDVFHEGTQALGLIMKRCETLVAVCKNGKEPEGEVVLPETFAQLVKASRVRLEQKDLKKLRPSEHYVLTKKLDGIEERVGGSEHTSRLEASLQEWEQAYTDAMALVARDLREKTAFEQLYKVVSGMLKQNRSLFEGYEAFFEKLKGSLKSARAQSEAEDGLRGADISLRSAKAEIERVIMASTKEGRERGLDLSRELRQGEASAKAGEERGKDQKAAWKARVDVFEKRWLPKVSGLAGAEDVTRLVDIAKKSAKQKPPDYEAANRYLQMAADRAQLTIQFPEGPVSVAITRLPQEAQKWTQAVTAFRASLDPLEQHFQTLEDPARAALRKGLAELRIQFDPNAFTPIVQRICAKGTDADARAQAREAALARVRQYRDVMVKDARFRLLQKHPFTKAGAWKGHLLLQRPLIELERLLLMAVPTA